MIQAGSTILLCAAVFQMFDAMNVTFVGALRGAGDTHGIAWITVGLLVTVFAPLSIGAVDVHGFTIGRTMVGRNGLYHPSGVITVVAVRAREVARD